MLAAQTAAQLGIERVYVPADPGTFAAEGTLLAPLRADAARVVHGGAPGGVRRGGARAWRPACARISNVRERAA